MSDVTFDRPFVFTVVVPCYNEEETLRPSVEGLLAIQDERLTLEVIIVDDCSRDASRKVAEELAREHSCIRLLKHEANQGKGGALQTGFAAATGEFVGVHDADMEYNPMDLRQLLVPLVDGRADAVLGSRYLNATGTRRVLYFYHTMINKGLTFVSNLFTDLDLTDMETCYKVFRRELIQSLNLEEKRFGIEPEMVSKLAHSKARVYERGISYDGRTYEEGKKIGWRDGVRALYCLFHYNAHCAPLPLQLLIYFFIGLTAAIVNTIGFLALLPAMSAGAAATAAFIVAAAVNYWLCIKILFRHKAHWSAPGELAVYAASVAVLCMVDVGITVGLIALGASPLGAKLFATLIGFVLNFFARKLLVFREGKLNL
ncbi:bifunctional glycosyltransferase family 2/GtrA family protein [Pseudodesulfovibrio sp.]|uniref:bifunctional glycosyltransferase family 2/GtrA family protein n=1 Tax=Pseudodesulfovibrio sp. TaxID=2035812 RepID=UPI002614E062|nr:bifunctional glycosyltransferase family 2/GtrA family protein [Pseudodesulfovibrio sp.]MDD3311837.1 bifunctional glycosyltransferase family 2/GtrA family protein [Pseudodesulfovibrio sp.]